MNIHEGVGYFRRERVNQRVLMQGLDTPAHSETSPASSECFQGDMNIHEAILREQVTFGGSGSLWEGVGHFGRERVTFGERG